MHRALLAPLGVTTPPSTVDDAVRSYLHARDERAAAVGAVVDPRLGEQVVDLMTTHGVLTATNL